MTGLADRWAAALVLVVRGHIPDPFVEANRVVLRPNDCELGPQYGWVADRKQVRPLGLDVSEQGLDPGLVGRGAGSAEVLADRRPTLSAAWRRGNSTGCAPY